MQRSPTRINGETSGHISELPEEQEETGARANQAELLKKISDLESLNMGTVDKIEELNQSHNDTIEAINAQMDTLIEENEAMKSSIAEKDNKLKTYLIFP